ncbi:phage baseplate assembly protein V [Cupriavidus sp. CV2]|uniref:phage baseplate assembly protein V n=1 Tax=Cupriavidus ulmosensis TaxID=3065913 RepID=UPI00296B33A0|nr:phage baseplate assembly protein V [Cupriavidus sp. CV2]MDW3683116.1 phage baseplate assembly protein V [Cupriavidus sp. CV2]
MSVPQLANILRAHAQMAQGEKTTHRVGQVTAYDPNKYAVRVKFWPDTVESSGWIPMASTYVGAGWGLVAAPGIGDQVIVAFDREDQDAGVVVGRFFTDVEQPPAAPSGEFWLVHKSGSALKFTNDGNVSLNVAGNLNATVSGNLSATAQQANVTASASASVSAPSISLKNAGAALKNLLNSAFATWAQNHVHSNGNGGANTGIPTTTPPANSQTSVVQAE